MIARIMRPGRLILLPLLLPCGRVDPVRWEAAPAGRIADKTRRSARDAELAAFLRAQRARLRPADVGLPEDSHPGRRRTPGLRREEVAEIAGVSVTWYTWLEQGRNISASEQVIDAVARAL